MGNTNNRVSRHVTEHCDANDIDPSRQNRESHETFRRLVSGRDGHRAETTANDRAPKFSM